MIQNACVRLWPRFASRPLDATYAGSRNSSSRPYSASFARINLSLNSVSTRRHTIELRGPDGAVILPQQLSAGERQLLAVSLLSGLAQASGRPLPVVIDTPLGRLDGIHRNHLVTRYFPQASHQVILLSTDQEIDRKAWRDLYPYVGHAYRLEHDTTNGYTTAQSGYFWPAPTS